MNWKSVLTKPVLADLMAARQLAPWLGGAAALQIGLVAFGLPGWPCPMLVATGHICPGCGLTRATIALLRGQWQTALTLHAFAPIFLALSLGIVASWFLPNAKRSQLVDAVASFESRTGLTAFLFIILLLYWLIRLFVFPASSAALSQTLR
jgi:hypothetical protein